MKLIMPEHGFNNIEKVQMVIFCWVEGGYVGQYNHLFHLFMTTLNLFCNALLYG